jgi:hypothetical protein
MVKSVLGLIALLSSSAYASSQVQFYARAYSDTRCGYYSTSSGDLHWTLSDEGLPWGTRVFLNYGFHDNFASASHQGQGQIEAYAVSDYAWRAELNGQEIDSRGSYSYDRMEARFEVRLPDGSTYVDAGGGNRYEAPLPQRECEPGTFVAQPVSVVE